MTTKAQLAAELAVANSKLHTAEQERDTARSERDRYLKEKNKLSDDLTKLRKDVRDYASKVSAQGTALYNLGNAPSKLSGDWLGTLFYNPLKY